MIKLIVINAQVREVLYARVLIGRVQGAAPGLGLELVVEVGAVGQGRHGDGGHAINEGDRARVHAHGPLPAHGPPRRFDGGRLAVGQHEGQVRLALMGDVGDDNLIYGVLGVLFWY